MHNIQGEEKDQIRHLGTYANELLSLNPNSKIVLQCLDSGDGPVFGIIYICLEHVRLVLHATASNL